MRDLNPFATRSLGREKHRAAYAAYMRSEAWFIRRRWWFEALSDAGRKSVECLGCGKNWLLGRDDVHHIDYTRLGHEEVDDLWPLCRSCHTLLHQVMESSKSWRKIPRRQANALAITKVKAMKSFNKAHEHSNSAGKR